MILDLSSMSEFILQISLQIIADSHLIAGMLDLECTKQQICFYEMHFGSVSLCTGNPCFRFFYTNDVHKITYNHNTTTFIIHQAELTFKQSAVASKIMFLYHWCCLFLKKNHNGQTNESNLCQPFSINDKILMIFHIQLVKKKSLQDKITNYSTPFWQLLCRMLKYQHENYGQNLWVQIVLE